MQFDLKFICLMKNLKNKNKRSSKKNTCDLRKNHI